MEWADNWYSVAERSRGDDDGERITMNQGSSVRSPSVGPASSDGQLDGRMRTSRPATGQKRPTLRGRADSEQLEAMSN